MVLNMKQAIVEQSPIMKAENDNRERKVRREDEEAKEGAKAEQDPEVPVNQPAESMVTTSSSTVTTMTDTGNQE